MRARRFNDNEKSQVMKLYNLGKSNSSIAEIFDTSRDRIARFIARTKEKENLPPKVNLRTTLTDGRIGNSIKRIVRDNPSIAYRDIRDAIILNGSDPEATPAHSTIRRFLKGQGFLRKKLVKKPFISEAAKAKRVLFAQDMLLNDNDYLSRVIFSDETCIRKAPKDKDISIIIHSSTRKEQIPINPQFHSGGFSVMFWGCFSERAFGPLVVIDGTMDRHQYIEILQDYVIPEIRIADDIFGSPVMFMQDNAPCHKARVVTRFLLENNVPVLDWPPYSPDLNPIENLWSIIKARRKKKFGVPLTKADLIMQISAIWSDLEPELALTLSSSFSNRLLKVIESRGNPINY